jgi:TolA-binding protein
MNLFPKSLVLGTCLATALLGCSSGLEGVDKRLAAMQEEITKVQGQNDRLVERLDAVEARQAKQESAAKAAPVGGAGKATGNAAASTGGPTVSERPSLKVVKVLPEDDAGMPSPHVGTQAPGEAADDPSPRPLIKLRGGGKADKGESKGES